MADGIIHSLYKIVTRTAYKFVEKKSHLPLDPTVLVDLGSYNPTIKPTTVLCVKLLGLLFVLSHRSIIPYWQT